MPKNDESGVAIARWALVVLVLLSGCMSATATYDQPSESGPIQITGVGVTKSPLGNSVWIDATIGPVDNATAAVWLGSDGTQIGAAKLSYGTNQINIGRGTDPERVYGQNRLVIVSGGETNCFGDDCEHIGGSEIINATFEVTKRD